MKKEAKHFFADKDIQIVLGVLLRVGVILSMSIVFMGGVIYLVGAGDKAVDYAVFDPAHSGYSTMVSIFKGLLSFNGKAIIQFGVLLLIFTPVARVAFSIFSFVIERDYLYVAIGLLVLSIILFSLSNKLVH
jgi:uncharacterized membrane protein